MSEYTDLSYRWESRDRLYATRSIFGALTALSAAEIEAISIYRAHEVEELPEPDRNLASIELARWEPPRMALR